MTDITTPWVLFRDADSIFAPQLRDKNTKLIATVNDNRSLNNSIKNAELIVRAVNNHDALVEALDTLLSSYDKQDFDDAFNKAEQALKLAKGE